MTVSCSVTDWNSQGDKGQAWDAPVVTDAFSTLRSALDAAKNGKSFTPTSEISVSGTTVNANYVGGECLAPVIIPSGVTLAISSGLKATSGNAGSEGTFIIVNKGGTLSADSQNGANLPIMVNQNISKCIVNYGNLTIGNNCTGFDIVSGDTNYALIMADSDATINLGVPALGGKIQGYNNTKVQISTDVYLSAAAVDGVTLPTGSSKRGGYVTVGVDGNTVTCYYYSANSGPSPW